VIFSKVAVDGTFPLKEALVDDGKGAPDVLVSMRWSDGKNDWGAPGLLTVAEGKRGAGSHASLSRYDLHNTLVAQGPDFKRGFVDELPSGNVDVAPTVLAILGVTPPKPTDGRVLSEALVASQLEVPTPEQKTLESTRDLGFRGWHQSLTRSQVGSVIYLDEGNGGSLLK
jgi:hypothetical protein